jgi:hypothetical protein
MASTIPSPQGMVLLKLPRAVTHYLLITRCDESEIEERATIILLL